MFFLEVEVDSLESSSSSREYHLLTHESNLLIFILFEKYLNRRSKS